MILFLGLIAYFEYNQHNVYEKNMIRYADKVIVKIERYQAEKGQLPSNLEQIFPDNAAVTDVYRLHTQGKDDYILTFITHKGDTMAYYSEVKTWKTKKYEKKK